MNQNENGLMEQFMHMQMLLHRYVQHARMKHGPLGDPHRGQGRVLSILKLQPEISQRELSYLLDIRNQSLGELLSKLEKAGYITRTPSQEDRRVMMIKLTPEGEAAADQTKRPSHDKLFDCLDEGEQETLKGLMEKIIRSLEEKVGNEPEDHHHPRGPWGGPDGHHHGRGPMCRGGYGGWHGGPDRGSRCPEHENEE